MGKGEGEGRSKSRGKGKKKRDWSAYNKELVDRGRRLAEEILSKGEGVHIVLDPEAGAAKGKPRKKAPPARGGGP